MPYRARGRRVQHHRQVMKKRKERIMAETRRTRKTAAERATEKANASILGDYFANHEEKKAVDREDRRLKRAVELIPDGQWGDYVKTYGDGRMVMDQDAVKARFEQLGEPVPMKITNAMIVRKV